MLHNCNVNYEVTDNLRESRSFLYFDIILIFLHHHNVLRSNLKLMKTHKWWLSVLVLDWWYLSISMLKVSEVKSAFRNLEMKDLITSKIMKLKAQFLYIKVPGSSQALQLHLAQLHNKSNLLVFCEILVSAWEGREVESTRN